MRTFEDLVVLAGVCVHWNGNPMGGSKPYPAWLLDKPNPRALDGIGFDDIALAYLVRGVLKLAGLELDAEGVLFPGGKPKGN